MRLTPKNRFLSILISLAVAGLTAYIVSRQGISVTDVKAAMESFHFSTLLFVLLANLAQNFMMMTRLAILIRGAGEPLSFRRVLRATAIGQMANAVLPARAGDVGKVFFLSAEEGGDDGKAPVAAATAIVLAEKVVDTIAFVFLLFVSRAVLLPEVREKVNGWMIFGGIIVLAGVLFLVKRKIPGKKWLEFVSGFRGVVRGKSFLPAVSAAIGVWFFEALAVKLLVTGLGHPLAWDRAFFVLCILNLAIAVPVSVGNLGTFEASIAMALRTIAIPLPEAVGIALVHHFFQLIAVFIWFLVALLAKKKPNPASAA